MTSILFLDDCPTRRKWATENIHGPFVERRDIRVTLVATAMDAIRALAEGPPYDLVYLDHDLDGEAWASPYGKNTGSEVVRWILLNKPKIGKVIVHSMNTPMGNRMARALRRAGYDAEYRSWLSIANDTVRAEPKLSAEDEAEVDRLYAEMLNRIANGPQWGLDPSKDA